MYKIYGLKLKNSDEIRYIGYTGKTLKNRLYRHLSECYKYNHKNANWIKKHKDIECIDIVLIEDDIYEIEEAWIREIYYIDKYRNNQFELNNSTDGGEGVSGEIVSLRVSGEGNPFYGKKHTDVSKQKMSNKAKDRTGDKNSFYGKNHRDDSKTKIAKSRIDKFCKENNPFYGKKHTEVSKLKMSINSENKKNKHSCKKISQIEISTGDILRVWDSVSEAAESILGDKKYGTYISAVCRGRKKQRGGYYWKYN